MGYGGKSRDVGGLTHDSPRGRDTRPQSTRQMDGGCLPGRIPTPEEFAPPASVTPPANLSDYMAAIGRKGGQIGGKRRMKTMRAEQRKKIARKAAKKRWNVRKREH